MSVDDYKYDITHDPVCEGCSAGYPLYKMATALGMPWRDLCPGYYWESDDPVTSPHMDICEEMAAEQGITIPALDPLPDWAVGMR